MQVSRLHTIHTQRTQYTMSIDVLRYVLKFSKPLVTSSEKLLLIAMADRCNESHKCWPSQKRLELDTCLNRKTIIACIQSLERKGILIKCAEKKGKLGRINVYQIVGVPSREDEEPITSLPNTPKSGNFNSPNSGTFNSPNIGTQNLKEEPKEIYIPPLPPKGGEGVDKKPSCSQSYKDSPEFMEFWRTYPNKQSPSAAYKAFRKLNPTPELLDIILNDIKQRQAYNWAGRQLSKIPYPATYLNRAEWEGDIFRDAPATQPAQPAQPQKAKSRFTEQLEAYRRASNATCKGIS